MCDLFFSYISYIQFCWQSIAAHRSSGINASELTRNPVDGFSAGLVDDTNIFEWAVTVIGPPDTL